jgi:NAD(P)-dependent dehydrogenase (short-subunit alcohol dehydrogenase family)
VDLELKDKVIVVSGGASGIGKAIVKALVAEGSVPFILDINRGATEEFVAEIQAAGNRIHFVIVDLTDSKGCQNAIHEVVEKAGSIYGVINNAGVNDGVGLENGSEESFQASLNKNVVHYYSLAHFALPFLKTTKGNIVNIVSKTYTTGQGGTSGYAAANGIRASITQDWAHELFKYDIKVNAVVVAECWTPHYEFWISQKPDPQKELDKITSRIPLENRMTTVDEIADMVLFILSGKSTFCSGQVIHVDGGYVHLDRAKP